MRIAENKKRRRAKGKGIGWKVEGVRLKAQGECMRSNLILFVLVFEKKKFVRRLIDTHSYSSSSS
jgi:hypothetical protein